MGGAPHEGRAASGLAATSGAEAGDAQEAPLSDL